MDRMVAMGLIPPRPILLYGGSYRKLLEAFGSLLEIGPNELRYLKVVSDLEELVEELERRLLR